MERTVVISSDVIAFSEKYFRVLSLDSFKKTQIKLRNKTDRPKTAKKKKRVALLPQGAQEKEEKKKKRKKPYFYCENNFGFIRVKYCFQELYYMY